MRCPAQNYTTIGMSIAISGNSDKVSFLLLQLASFYLQAQKVGCAVHYYLSNLAYEGQLFWAEAIESFVVINEPSAHCSEYYVVLSFNNQSFKLGLLRNLRVDDIKPRAAILSGEYNPATGNKVLFDEPLQTECVSVNYTVSPDKSNKE